MNTSPWRKVYRDTYGPSVKSKFFKFRSIVPNPSFNICNDKVGKSNHRTFTNKIPDRFFTIDNDQKAEMIRIKIKLLEWIRIHIGNTGLDPENTPLCEKQWGSRPYN